MSRLPLPDGGAVLAAGVVVAGAAALVAGLVIAGVVPGFRLDCASAGRRKL